jgi:hypothetical protein
MITPFLYLFPYGTAIYVTLSFPQKYYLYIISSNNQLSFAFHILMHTANLCLSFIPVNNFLMPLVFLFKQLSDTFNFLIAAFSCLF